MKKTMNAVQILKKVNEQLQLCQPDAKALPDLRFDL